MQGHAEDVERYRSWVGRTAVDPSGRTVGTIEDVYADDDSGAPEWLLVKTGWFGTRLTFVPVGGCSEAVDTGRSRGSAEEGPPEIVLGVDRDIVRHAPNVLADGQLDTDDEDGLYAYYGLRDRAEPGEVPGPAGGEIAVRQALLEEPREP